MGGNLSPARQRNKQLNDPVKFEYRECNIANPETW